MHLAITGPPMPSALGRAKLQGQLLEGRISTNTTPPVRTMLRTAVDPPGAHWYGRVQALKKVCVASTRDQRNKLQHTSFCVLRKVKLCQLSSSLKVRFGGVWATSIMPSS